MIKSSISNPPTSFPLPQSHWEAEQMIAAIVGLYPDLAASPQLQSTEAVERARKQLEGIERIAEEHTGISGARSLQTAMHAITHAARAAITSLTSPAVVEAPQVERHVHGNGVTYGLREARQIAFDQQSDDPAPGNWNDACLHIAQMIEDRAALLVTDKTGVEE